MRAPSIILISLVLAGCGSGGSAAQSHPSDPAPAGNHIGDGTRGGHATFVAGGDVDFVDPGQTYDPLGFMVAYATNRPLYSYSPAHPTQPVPDLADGAPEVSRNNRTITVHLKPGIRYAPPLHQTVRAQDVRYAIERAFSTSVPSGYASTYFGSIAGAPRRPVAINRLGIFEGLQTPDDLTLVIKLTRPVAQEVVAGLALPITVPVPQRYAARFDHRVPSTYDQHVAFTGPYMVRHDATGRLTGRVPGRRIDLVRNPSWDAKTDYRPAYLDGITIAETTTDPATAVRRTLAGKGLLCCDTQQPPIPTGAPARQVASVYAGGTRWVAFNTTKRPLDNVDVRRAIVAGVDRDALRGTRGGASAGPVAQSFLPPGIPGFAESGGLNGFSSTDDFLAHSRGDMAVFKKYMLKSGVPVDPATGKYTGSARISIVSDNADPSLRTSRVLQRALARLGFATQFRKVPRDVMTTRYCGVPRAEPSICPSVGWFKDLVDPQSMLAPTFGGAAIKPAANVNYSQLDDPAVNRAMASAALLSEGDRSNAWAAVNKAVTALAPGIPYIWDEAYGVQSADMLGVMNGYLTTWDLSFSSLKQP